MLNFDFSGPKHIIFGRDTHKRVGRTVAELGYRKVLLVYDGGTFLKETGLLGEVLSNLREAGITVYELTGILPNPRLGKVHEGVAICKENGVEMIVALGGGSTIDTAKAVAAGALYDGDVWDYFSNVMGAHVVFEALPIGVILTIAATGSETNGGMMITNEDGWIKYGAGGPGIVPTFSICNPQITCSLPAYQTACGVIDMYTHVVERYFTNTPDTYVIDAMCEGIFRTLQDIGPRLLADPQNYNLRAEVMWTGTIAHNDTVGVGREQDWATHDLSYELSALYDLTHGSAVAVMMLGWMKFVWRHDVARFVRYAKYAMGVDTAGKTDEEAALEGIARTEAFVRRLGLPAYISEAGIDDSRFAEMAERALANREFVGNFVKLGKDDIMTVYRLAYEQGEPR